MKIVINIPEERYKYIKSGAYDYQTTMMLYNAVQCGKIETVGRYIVPEWYGVNSTNN